MWSGPWQASSYSVELIQKHISCELGQLFILIIKLLLSERWKRIVFPLGISLSVVLTWYISGQVVRLSWCKSQVAQIHIIKGVSGNIRPSRWEKRSNFRKSIKTSNFRVTESRNQMATQELVLLGTFTKCIVWFRELNQHEICMTHSDKYLCSFRMTLLLGPPGCGKSTLLKALAGKLDKSLKVS